MPGWVLGLDQVGKQDLAKVGGKAANLGEMARAGLPVPPGFVLTTEAYRSFVSGFGLQPEIERLAGQLHVEDPGEVERVSAALRASFEKETVPEALREAIEEAYLGLGEGPVAVRSSATAEDLAEASFAGQQESYLNLEGVEAVLEAVLRCWSSLWTARALAYRARQGIPPAAVSLAVVVQRLVPAEVSGILFTANPVNGRRDQMVVDAAWGLGEAIVGGRVTPDHWVLDKTSGEVAEDRPGLKTVMTVRTAGSTMLQPVSEEKQRQPALDAAMLAALVELGSRIEAHFGSPQDVEWAVDSERLHVVQSRPITSLFPIPAPSPSPETGLRVHVCVNFLQGFPQPLTPLGLAAFRGIARGVAGILGVKPPRGITPGAFRVAAGRIYVDVTAALRNRRSRVVALTIPGILDRPMTEILRLLVEREPSLSPPNAPFPVKPPWSLLPIAGRILLTALSPDTGRRLAVGSMEKHLHRLELRASTVKGIEERIELLQEEGERLPAALVGYLGLPVMVPAMAARSLAEAKLKAWLGDAGGLQPILRALPHNPTMEMDLALWRVSRKLRAEGVPPRAEDPAVGRFLEAYGHRGVREIDLGMPRWRDDPSPILKMLSGYLAHDEQMDPLAEFRRGTEEAERATEELVSQVRRKKGALRAALLRFLIGRVRALLGMREYPKFMAVKCLAVLRRVALDAGAGLAEAGRLDRAEDIFFLDPRDLRSGVDLRARVAANRSDYERELSRRAVPRVVTSTGEAFYGAVAASEGALAGTPASPGVHEGRVRVVHEPYGAQLEPGEVLVAPGTDPAWTPLFLTAGALVMEIGGTMSHGSVVAREYGIPAVVGVAGATTRLRTGQRVRVDGESGLVLPLD